MGKGIIAIIIAVICLLYFVSPADLSPGLPGLDDLGALAGLIMSIVGSVKAFKKDHPGTGGDTGSDSGTDGDYNDVNNN